MLVLHLNNALGADAQIVGYEQTYDEIQFTLSRPANTNYIVLDHI